MAQRKKNAKKKKNSNNVKKTNKKKTVKNTPKKVQTKKVDNPKKKVAQKNKKQIKNKIEAKNKIESKKKNTKNSKEQLTKKTFSFQSILKKLPKLEKKIIISDNTKHKLIIISISLLILAILLMIPYGKTIYKSDASNKNIEVPKFVKLKEECCNFKATFSTIRSTWSLKYDLEKMLKSYEVINCDGKKYYYNEKEDYTITDYGVKNGLIINQIYITYGKGNSCDIDPTFKKLELLPSDFSIADAKKDGNLVIEQDNLYNKEAYDTFIENVKQNIPNILRIVKTTEENDVLIIDLEYTKEGKYKVVYDATRDRNSKEHNSFIAYYYENIGIYQNKLYAYNGNSITKNSYYLFTISED